MSDKKLKAADKTVQKMSREGLVEQNLSTGATERVSKREQDFKVGGSSDKQKPAEQPRPAISQSHANVQTAAAAALHKPDTPRTNNPRAAPVTQSAATGKPSDHEHKPRIKPDAQDTGAATVNPPAAPSGDTPTVKYTRESKLRHAEATVEKTDKKLEKVRKKQPHKKRLVSEKVLDEKTQKPKTRLYFEDVPAAAKKSKLITSGVKAAGGMAALGVHRKLYQAEYDNAGVKAAHRSEMAGETALRAANRYRRARPQRLAKKAVRLEKKAAKAQANLRFEKAVKKNPALAKQSALRKFMHKKKLQRKYIKQAQKQAKKAAKKTAEETAKTTKRLVLFIARHPIATLIIAGLLILILCFQSCMNSGFIMIGGVGSTFSGFYPAQDYDINQAELYYTEKETNLQIAAKKLETDNPGYDEYRYVGETSHDPFELMAYLSAVYGEFTFNTVKPHLDALFNEQYVLSSREITETRTDADGNEYEVKILEITVTNQPLARLTAPKMNDEQTQMYLTYLYTHGGRFYFAPPVVGWTAKQSDRYGWRVHPITGAKDFHDAADIALPVGTPVYAVQNGTVTAAGTDGGYGIRVIVESSDGLKSLYAHLDRVSVRVGQTVEYGTEIGRSGNTGTSTGAHLHLSVYKNGQSLNPAFFVDPG
ncbi:MAG: peptidoglycan DD-metalloendopeptidase family protein [Oscillospiraceae bacterium]|jgi:murein DD-endopeptidase MepM/ murein hydrolase activator NlpD|nr:peptidoglycan DD-metalloendopeptidase family protein [Oscillospiraceae bacterium]